LAAFRVVQSLGRWWPPA